METGLLDALRIAVMAAAVVMAVMVAWTGYDAPAPRKHLHGVVVVYGVTVLLFQPTRLGEPDVSPLLICNMLGTSLGLLYLWSFRRSERACATAAPTVRNHDGST